VGYGNKYLIDGQQQPTLELVEGNTYVFDWSAASGHPFRFSTTANGTHASGVQYTTGVTYDDVNYTTTIVVAASAPTLFYYCPHHSGMGGQANTTSSVNVRYNAALLARHGIFMASGTVRGMTHDVNRETVDTNPTATFSKETVAFWLVRNEDVYSESDLQSWEKVGSGQFLTASGFISDLYTRTFAENTTHTLGSVRAQYLFVYGAEYVRPQLQITLTGGDITTGQSDDSYTDPGHSVTDQSGATLNDVVTTTIVNEANGNNEDIATMLQKPGTYILSYSLAEYAAYLTNVPVTRRVTVNDVTNPVIILNGDAHVSIAPPSPPQVTWDGNILSHVGDGQALGWGFIINGTNAALAGINLPMIGTPTWASGETPFVTAAFNVRTKVWMVNGHHTYPYPGGTRRTQGDAHYVDTTGWTVLADFYDVISPPSYNPATSEWGFDLIAWKIYEPGTYTEEFDQYSAHYFFEAVPEGFSDPGVQSVTDQFFNNLNINDVIITTTPSTPDIGTVRNTSYTINYSVTDDSGNVGNAVRTIAVGGGSAGGGPIFQEDASGGPRTAATSYNGNVKNRTEEFLNPLGYGNVILHIRSIEIQTTEGQHGDIVFHYDDGTIETIKTRGNTSTFYRWSTGSYHSVGSYAGEKTSQIEIRTTDATTGETRPGPKGYRIEKMHSQHNRWEFESLVGGVTKVVLKHEGGGWQGFVDIDLTWT